MEPCFFIFLILAFARTVELQEMANAMELCSVGLDGSKAVKKWIHTDLNDSDFSDKDSFDTIISPVKNTGHAEWFLVSRGSQGIFYYKKGKTMNGDERGLTNILTHLVEACRSGTVWTLRFEELEGPLLTYPPPSHYSHGAHPLQRDPYEERTVEVKQSEEPGAKDGLFARRDVLSGEVLAFYSGLVIYCESSLRALDRRELSDEEEHVRNMYNIALDIGEDDDNLCIDLPPEMGNDVNR